MLPVIDGVHSGMVASPARNRAVRGKKIRRLIEARKYQGDGCLDLYKMGPILGQGAFGKVSLAVHRLSGEKVAVKTYSVGGGNPQVQKEIMHEVSVLSRIRHPGIVAFYELIKTRRAWHIVMEHVSGGSLKGVLRRHHGPHGLPETQAAAIMAQILSSVACLHAHRCVHRDIKLENTAVDKDGYVKLIDFGLSTILEPGSKLRQQCGSLFYMAPEILCEPCPGYNEAVDIWACGVLAHLLLLDFFPFRMASNTLGLYQLCKKAHLTHLDLLSRHARMFLTGLLNPNPKKRMGAADALKHPWIQQNIQDQKTLHNSLTQTQVLSLESVDADFEDDAPAPAAFSSQPPPLRGSDAYPSASDYDDGFARAVEAPAVTSSSSKMTSTPATTSDSTCGTIVAPAAGIPLITHSTEDADETPTPSAPSLTATTGISGDGLDSSEARTPDATVQRHSTGPETSSELPSSMRPPLLKGTSLNSAELVIAINPSPPNGPARRGVRPQPVKRSMRPHARRVAGGGAKRTAGAGNRATTCHDRGYQRAGLQFSDPTPPAGAGATATMPDSPVQLCDKPALLDMRPSALFGGPLENADRSPGGISDGDGGPGIAGAGPGVSPQMIQVEGSTMDTSCPHPQHVARQGSHEQESIDAQDPEKSLRGRARRLKKGRGADTEGASTDDSNFTHAFKGCRTGHALVIDLLQFSPPSPRAQRQQRSKPPPKTNVETNSGAQHRKRAQPQGKARPHRRGAAAARARPKRHRPADLYKCSDIQEDHSQRTLQVGQRRTVSATNESQRPSGWQHNKPTAALRSLSGSHRRIAQRDMASAAATNVTAAAIDVAPLLTGNESNSSAPQRGAAAANPVPSAQSRLNQDVLARMTDLGFSQQVTTESLIGDLRNHETVTYCLLCVKYDTQF